MPNLDTTQRHLLKRLAELGGRLTEIETELLSHSNQDWDELAHEREDDEVLERLGRSGQAEITRIRAALDRIAQGTYGICTTCGEPIGEDRLAALPDTPVCRTCAMEHAA